MYAEPDIRCRRRLPEATALSHLRSSRLFCRIDDELLRSFASGAVTRRLTNGATIWRRGETINSLAIVQSGLVAVRKLSPHGEITLVGLFGPGDTLCITPILTGQPVPAEAVAVSEVATVLSVRAAPILDLASTHSGISQALIGSLLEHTEILRDKIDVVSAGSVPRRLAVLMRVLVDRFGIDFGNNHASLPFALTREQVGQLIGARTETVSRILSKWTKARWFASKAGITRIDRLDILQRIVDGRSDQGSAQPVHPRATGRP